MSASGPTQTSRPSCGMSVLPKSGHRQVVPARPNSANFGSREIVLSPLSRCERHRWNIEARRSRRAARGT